MKSRIAVSVLSLSVAVLSLMLGGCGGVPESDPVSTPSSDNSVNLSESDPTSTPQTDNSGDTQSNTKTSSVTLDPETQKLIDEFPLDTFVGFDGKEVKKTDAVGAMQGEGGQITYLTYDFAYLRYAKPIWKNTLLNADLIDWETYEFNDDTARHISDPNYFSVKTGDVLDNGLSVKKATTIFYPQRADGENGESGFKICQSRSTVNFEGQLTLNGILHCVAEDTDYIDMGGDLFFYADPSDGKLIVPSKENLKMDRIASVVDPETKFALLCDGQRFYLGNVNEGSEIDLSGVIDKGEYRNATVTLENVRIVFTQGVGATVYGTLVSASAD